MGPSPERACSVDIVRTTSITSQRDNFLIYETYAQIKIYVLGILKDKMRYVISDR